MTNNCRDCNDSSLRRLFVLQFFASERVRFPDSISIPSSTNPSPIFTPFPSGRGDVFCFRIDDELELKRMITEWHRIRFHASWSVNETVAADVVDGELEGVSCPVASCHHDCYGDNFDVVKFWQTSKIYEENVEYDNGASNTSVFGGKDSVVDHSVTAYPNLHGDAADVTSSEGGGVYMSDWSAWIIGQLWILPRMRRDGAATKR